MKYTYTFDQLRRDKTTIFVSHRLSSATVASKIVVLEYGEVVEEGTHAELMEKRGKYYELFSTQAKRYVSEGEKINDPKIDINLHRQKIGMVFQQFNLFNNM